MFIYYFFSLGKNCFNIAGYLPFVLHLKTLFSVTRMKVTLSKQEIEDSIRYAAIIQSTLMPEPSLMKKYFPESFVLFKPRDIVSGDFYWFQKKQNRIAVIAADCTGHGVPGAFMSILGINFLNLITVSCIPPSNQLLNKLREYVMKALKQEGTNPTRKEGIDMTACIFDLDKKIIEFSGAITPLIYFKNNTLYQLKSDPMPVGAGPVEEEAFTKQVIPFSGVDMLYLFSDGYPDQFGGEKNKKLKYSGFRNSLSQINKLNCREQCLYLEKFIKDWMNKFEQTDDILVIGINIQSLLNNETNRI